MHKMFFLYVKEHLTQLHFNMQNIKALILDFSNGLWNVILKQ